LPSLRAKRSNLAVKEINELGIASSQKTLLAMTFQGFFNSLTRHQNIPKYDRQLKKIIEREYL